MYDLTFVLIHVLSGVLFNWVAELTWILTVNGEPVGLKDSVSTVLRYSGWD